MSETENALSILHIILAVRETSAPYNEHCLPWADKRDISICSYFKSDTACADNITLFEGDGSLRGFFRALETALAAKRYDVIHAHSPHVASMFLAAAVTRRRDLMPSTVVTVHDSYEDFKLRNRLMFLPVFAGFRRTVCCSRASYDSFPPLYKWLAGERLSAVPNGLDIARVDRVAAGARRSRPRNGAFMVMSVGRLVEVKNPLALLKAFHRMSAAGDRLSRLVFVGAGPLHDSLVANRTELGVDDQVELTGLIPREQVFARLLDADLFVSTSRGEGLPVAVLEAMSCGLPVVLSDIPPHREIAEGVDFIPLIQPEDSAGFAQAIAEFRDMPALERASVGRACRQLVEDRFSLQAMHAGYGEVYAQITHRPTQPLEASA